jgi:hypothetical protein
MLLRMLTCSRSRRASVLWVLPVALWAAVPAVQWCPFGWSRACAAPFPRCPNVAAATATCGMPAAAACGADAGTCMAAWAGEPDGRAAANGEPDARAADPAPSCPLMTARLAREAGRGTRPVRAFCLGDPNGGAGMRTHAPAFGHEMGPAVGAVVASLAAPPRLVTSPVPQRASRPPEHPWSRRPPARAPPSSLVA